MKWLIIINDKYIFEQEGKEHGQYKRTDIIKKVLDIYESKKTPSSGPINKITIYPWYK